MKSYTIGLDLGGTKLAAALLDAEGVIIDFVKVPVEMKKDGSAIKTQKRIVSLMVDIALDFRRRFPQQVSKAAFKGIGLASAGPLNVEKGALINPVNYPGWKIVPIREMLEKELSARGFKTPVFFQHDATAAALAEGWIGGAKGMKSYAVVTVGTGVGTGIVFNGQPAQSQGMGSECGHIVVNMPGLKLDPDNIFKYTVEGMASGTALLRRAQELGFKGHSVEELVAAEDDKYSFLFEDMAWALSSLCHNLSISYNLEGIFISGGLIKIRKLFMGPLKAHYKKMVRQINADFECKVEIAKTQNHAGVIGAGYLPYLHKLQNTTKKATKKAPKKTTKK